MGPTNVNQRRQITCKVCKEKKMHHAKGMCYSCYRKEGWNKKMIVCKNCGKGAFHKAFGLCASCHVKLYHYPKVKEYLFRERNAISEEEFKKATERCAACGFEKIVEAHILDSRVVGLCPNHHRMLHDARYCEEVRAEINKNRAKG